VSQEIQELDTMKTDDFLSWELDARMILQGAIRKTGKLLRSIMLCSGSHTWFN
jgi:hypothetical protein